MKIKRFLDIEQQLQSRIKLRANEVAKTEKYISLCREELKSGIYPEYMCVDIRQDITECKQDRKAMGIQQILDKSLMKVYRAVLSDVRIHQKNGYPIEEVF